jgi:hypothetical protein
MTGVAGACLGLVMPFVALRGLAIRASNSPEKPAKYSLCFRQTPLTRRGCPDGFASTPRRTIVTVGGTTTAAGETDLGRRFTPMPAIKITTKTSEEIAVDFEAVFSGIKPAQKSKPKTQADRLAPYRKAIAKQRRRGLSWKQIADAMADPRIDEKVTERLLIRVFGQGKKAAQKPLPSAPAGLAADHSDQRG